MATAVIFHAPEDTLPARALAEKLRAAKLTVVLEQPAGEAARAAAKSAQVTVALWSPRAVGQAAIIEDVAAVRGKAKILHACMQSATTPDQFRGDKSVNLTGWRGEDDFPAWRELAKLITDRAGVAPLPPPAPRPPSGFFQPGRVAPANTHQPLGASGRQAAQPSRAPQRPAAQAAARPAQPPTRPAPAHSAPRSAPPAAAEEPKKSGGGLMVGLAALAVVLLGGGGYYFWSQSQSAQTTSAAWEEVQRNDAAALRAFIDGDPGDFRDEALAALAELEVRSYEAASDADTVEALEAFLNDFPESEHALAARGRVAELQSQTAPPTEAAPEAAPDADLVPPDAAPDAGGPATIAPPAAETPAPVTPPAEAPTN